MDPYLVAQIEERRDEVDLLEDKVPRLLGLS